MKVLVTGAADFIGMHVSQRLLALGKNVIRIDNLGDRYDVSLKKSLRAQLRQYPGFHLDAQAGVRYSLTNTHAYADSNLIGFVNVLEGCRCVQVQHWRFSPDTPLQEGIEKFVTWYHSRYKPANPNKGAG